VSYDGTCTVDEGEGQGLVEVLLEGVDRHHRRGGVDLVHVPRKGDDAIDPDPEIVVTEVSKWSEVKIG